MYRVAKGTAWTNSNAEERQTNVLSDIRFGVHTTRNRDSGTGISDESERGKPLEAEPGVVYITRNSNA